MSEYIKNKENLDEYLVNATKNITGNLTGLWEHRAGDIYLFDTDVTLTNGIISVSSDRHYHDKIVLFIRAYKGFLNH